MPKRLQPPLVLLIAVLATGSGLAAARSAATTSSATTARVDVAATLRRGESRILYAPRGLSGPVGRFRVACSSSRRSSTTYTRTRSAADTLAAVTGRAVSRGRVLTSASPALRGGSGVAGIERWLLRMGREPEDVLVDVSLVVIPRTEAPGYCEFWMQGSVTVIRR